MKQKYSTNNKASSSVLLPKMHIWGLVKKFYLLPCNFLVLNSSILKIDMDIHWTFIYTQGKLCIDTFTRFLYVTSEVNKGFGTNLMTYVEIGSFSCILTSKAYFQAAILFIFRSCNPTVPSARVRRLLLKVNLSSNFGFAWFLTF